ncbi:hypothetical protein ABZT03_11750 [Streptomyces sp. NPDC005574]|uniref:hypothetical protein n=1 Tax=Streptomyces sp. NPDC005574 TaxID=3156891 RepID=UPI0033B41061
MSTQPDTSATASSSEVLALLPLPSLDGLSEQQVRGKACVWCCITLPTGLAVDLGPRTTKRAGSEVRWFPRSCRQDTARQAMAALFDHAPGCAVCSGQPEGCATGAGLRRLTRGGWQ